MIVVDHGVAGVVGHAGDDPVGEVAQVRIGPAGEGQGYS